MDSHPASRDEAKLLRDCRVTRTRRSGPGGQHRNKVETAIVIEHLPTGIRAEANERRSQEQNRKVAIQRLRVNLALAIRHHVNHDSAVSALWTSRRESDRIRISGSNDAFPALLAEALDAISAHNFDLASAAQQLGVSSSQLVKLLRVEDRALQLVNQQRSDRGLHALH